MTEQEKPILTARNAEVIGLRADGLTSAEIADLLGITKRTIDYHLAETYKRLSTPEKRIRNAIEAINALKALCGSNGTAGGTK